MRGYRDESKYWDDFFKNKPKPIKYRISYQVQSGKTKGTIKYKPE